MTQDGLATVKLQASTSENLQALTELAEFWKIPYNDDPASNSHDVAIISGLIPEQGGLNSPTVLCPSGDENARRISERLDLGLNITTSLIRLPFSRSADTSVRAKTYNFSGTRLKTIIDSYGIPVLSRLDSTDLYLLSVDLASTLSLLMSRGLDDPPSFKFRMATRLPLSYRMIPSFVRNRAFRKDEEGDVARESVGSIEGLRTIFLATLLCASNMPLPLIGFWKRGKKFGAAITHDVETERGLIVGSELLLGVEGQLGIRSTWNVVSNRYPLTRENLRPLSQSGEIGAHDTNHDGRLIFLSSDSRTERLRDCRETLERISGSKVKGFRAPLLQHDKELLTSVGEAGYICDSSVPSWELLSPTSLRSHGVGTVFPLSTGEIVEVPVSLPQDHQLLRVRGLSPSEGGTVWARESQWLREIGGMCTLLIHPDYDFATEAYIDEYSRVLKSFSQDPACQVMTLGETAEWWSHRQKARLEVSSEGKRVSLVGNGEGGELHILVASRFDKNGFAIEEFN